MRNGDGDKCKKKTGCFGKYDNEDSAINAMRSHLEWADGHRDDPEIGDIDYWSPA